MEEEKISIIMPAYNAEKTIRQCIHSVLEQTYKNYELIIVNDGSNDNTSTICKQFEKDDKIKYIEKENEGVSKARNIGIQHATGNYICFIDSDDEYENNYLENMVNEIIKMHSDLVICGYKAITNKEKDVNYEEEFTTNNLSMVIEKLQPIVLFNHVWNKIFKSEIVKQNKIHFDETMSIAEDCKFVLDYLKFCHSISYLNQVLYNYTITDNGLGFKYRNDKNEIKLQLIDNIKNMYEHANNNMEYVYKSYIKQLYAAVSNMVDKRLKLAYKEKRVMIQEFLNHKNNIIRKKEIQKVNDLKYKILAKMIIRGQIDSIMLLGRLANIYDKHNKRKLLNKE